jgi:hypothetical protein
MGWIDLSMACYEDGGAMPLCDVAILGLIGYIVE